MGKKPPFDLPLLPPLIDLVPLVAEIGRANHLLGRLNGLVYTLPNPDLLITPLVTKEAVLSSKIEGTQASLEDVFHYEAAQSQSEESDDERDIREIINYRKALKLALSEIKKRPVGENLIKKMHSVLLNSVRGSAKDRGNFRRAQVFIGRPGETIDKAIFVPPGFNAIPKLVSNWEKFHHTDDGLDPLVKIAILHYQFEAIHPFLDGNGRIGRLLITLSLYEKELLAYPVLYISEYFEQNRSAYYQLLQAVSEDGAWTDWIAFFLTGISVQSERAEKTAKKILKLYSELKDEVTGINSQYAVRFLDLIFASPVFTFNSIRDRLGTKAQQTVYNLIAKFIAEGIVREQGDQKRNRKFEFPRLLALLK
ncbi:MAG: Fic family protein [Pseudomonadota bacterium]|jgi:Fic family protein